MGKNKIIIAATLAVAAIAVSIISLYSKHGTKVKNHQSTEIIAVHDGFHLLVKNFPYSDYGKINWWLKQEEKLKQSNYFPDTSQLGNFRVIIWDFGDGYKKMPASAQELDLACFKDMDTDVNCIEKKRVMTVVRYEYGRKTKYDIPGGGLYIQRADSEKLEKRKRD